MPDRVDEILEKLYEEGNFEGEHREIHPDRIREAKAELLKVMLECVPKKKQGITFKGKHSLEPYSPSDKVKVAYNKAIDNVIEAMERLFGKERGRPNVYQDREGEVVCK